MSVSVSPSKAITQEPLVEFEAASVIYARTVEDPWVVRWALLDRSQPPQQLSQGTTIASDLAGEAEIQEAISVSMSVHDLELCGDFQEVEIHEDQRLAH